jgi:hypothetical protein
MQAHRSGQLFPILMATWLTESSALADAPLPARDELRGSSPSGLAGADMNVEADDPPALRRTVGYWARSSQTAV